MRYLDPDFMREPGEPQFRPELPKIYEPLNAFANIQGKKVDLEEIKEAEFSIDENEEIFTFRRSAINYYRKHGIIFEDDKSESGI